MEVDHLSCMDCKNKRSCPNLKNTRVSRAKSPFMCSALSGIPCICFAPVFNVYEDQTKDMAKWIDEFERQWMPKQIEKSTVPLVIDGVQEVRYHVRLSDWINCSLFSGNLLKSVYKEYYQRTRSCSGYKLIKEEIGYVDLNTFVANKLDGVTDIDNKE